MRSWLLSIMLLLLCVTAAAQEVQTSIKSGDELDSVRRKLEGRDDSVVFTARYIKVTNLKLSADSVFAVPLDTAIRGFQHYNLLQNPLRPTVGLGNLGQAAMPLLYEPYAAVGFNTGFNAFNMYKRTPDELNFYVARTPYTSLYYVNGTLKEQVFRATHSRNVNNNLNVTATFERIGAEGFYNWQRGDVLNGSINGWYKSPNKRYIVFAGGVWNTMKANENGATTNTEVFTKAAAAGLKHANEPVRFTSARQLYRGNYYFIKQSFNVGRVDSVINTFVTKIMPTNKFTHYLEYSKNSGAFYKNELDNYNILPAPALDSTYTRDTTTLKRLRNELSYTFFLRGRQGSNNKNEIRLTAGVRNDVLIYNQQSLLASGASGLRGMNGTYINNWLIGSAGYSFSDRAAINVDVQQIFQGRDIGDFDYKAQANIFVSNKIGAVTLSAGLQNRHPDVVYENYTGNYGSWQADFKNTKTARLGFEYFNPDWQLKLDAKYFLIDNYLYFKGTDSVNISPAQLSGRLSVAQLGLYKWFRFGRFNLESYLIYQFNSNKDVLFMPDFYTFNSFYIRTKLFKVLNTDAGIDVRYNTNTRAYSYFIPAAQFYVGQNISFKQYPVADVFVRANLKRASLLLKYSYANQGLLSKGYYTVNRYPMADAVLALGVQWNFYD